MKKLFFLALLMLPLAARAQQMTYVNPVLGGDWPDPSIMRDGEDYYMTHSSFDYQPGLTVLHSRDLVHWRPISCALNRYLGSVWAPDIKKYKGKYYIYFTVASRSGKQNWVVTSDRPEGPWSEPQLVVNGMIDPCHVVGEDGKRYLVLSGGNRITLTDDGLHAVEGSTTHFYDGWIYPSEWITEGMCLEGPKVYRIGKWFYYISAEGGTAGPPTSHMVVVARSKSINGPWENMPSNPLIHTSSAKERWWSRGHGSLIDTPDGKWYIVYHAYENGYLNLGRQMLMEPVHFTADGWIESDGGDASGMLPAPLKSGESYDRLARLDEFRVGYEWRFYKDFRPERMSVSGRELTLQGEGTNVGSSHPMLFNAGTHAYEVETEVEIIGNATAGLTIFYNAGYNVGIAFNGKNVKRVRRNDAGGGTKVEQKRIWLRLCNEQNVVYGYWSADGKHWEKQNWALEISGFNHNTLYDFQSMLPGLFVYGDGKAVFRNLKYTVKN